MPRHINHLTQVQKFELTNWLLDPANTEKLGRRRATYDEAAALAQKALGCHITGGNILGICKAFPQTEWEHRVGMKPGASPVPNQMREQIADLEARVSYLERSFGIEPDQEEASA